MQKFIVITPQLVHSVGKPGAYCTLDEVPALLGKQRGPVLFAIVPQTVGRVLATERTIDTAMPGQFPGPNSFSIEPLESTVYQVYVAPDELLNRLRAMARDVRVVPYPAAVRATVATHRRPQESRLLERTRVFLAGAVAPESVRAPQDRVVVDRLGDDYLITALRGREILVVRFAQGGDPVTELQRSLAANRMSDPVILTKDQALALELKSQGFNAEVAELPGELIGESGLEKVLSLRFLNEMEVAQQRAVEGRRRAASFLGVSLLLAAVAGGAHFYLQNLQARAFAENEALVAPRAARLSRLISLYQERYATLAKRESLQIREELYDLSISLPPQVALLSVQKDSLGLSAVVERRPGAAPFSRDDLRSALAASPFFADAKIREEYEGHVVRYLLSKPPAPRVGALP